MQLNTNCLDSKILASHSCHGNVVAWPILEESIMPLVIKYDDVRMVVKFTESIMPMVISMMMSEW